MESPISNTRYTIANNNRSQLCAAFEGRMSNIRYTLANNNRSKPGVTIESIISNAMYIIPKNIFGYLRAKYRTYR